MAIDPNNFLSIPLLSLKFVDPTSIKVAKQGHDTKLGEHQIWLTPNANVLLQILPVASLAGYFDHKGWYPDFRKLGSSLALVLAWVNEEVDHAQFIWYTG